LKKWLFFGILLGKSWIYTKTHMAENNTKKLAVNDAAIPEWLKKAQKIANSKEILTDTAAQKPAEQITPEKTAPKQIPLEQIPTAKPEETKTNTLKSAKFSFMSLMEKAGKAIKKSQTAGVPPVKTEKDIAAEQEAIALEQAKEKITAAETNVENAKNAKLSGEKTTAEEKKALVEGEKIYQQGIATIRDLIAPSSMEIRYDVLRVEGMYSQSFYVYAYPRYMETNWLSPVINFDVTMDISQFIYPIDSATIMRVLKKKVAQMQASVRINAEKGMVSDPSLNTALEDAEELRIQITRGQEKFFQFALYFTIYSEDEKKISKTAKQLESILGGKLILTKRTELQMENGFNSCIPMATDELEVSLNMNTSPLSSTFPFSSADLTSNEGILYGLNRHNDSLIIFDRFSLENANSVVFAKSGAGKSYCVKLEILRSMMMGTDVIVIDPENEYEALAQTVGGAYLKVSLTSDRRINAFDLPPPVEGEEVQPGDLLRSNIINLHGLLKIMLGGVTPQEEGILDKALNDVYSLKGITMELVDPTTIPPPTMEDLYDILSTMEGGMSLAQRLQKFTSGTYSGIFNKPTNVDLESGLMVFSIRDLEDSLRPIAMYIILNYIWSRIRRKLKKRVLVIDEAWSLMQHDDSAKFLFGLVKRARKYYLGITTITQDVEDFVKSPYGKPVVTNSSLQLLLKQAPAAIDVLGKVFNLTEGEKYMLLNSGVGQGLFFAGLKHVAIQVIASYTEDKIVTTNPEEILKEKGDAESYK
jgi:conjugal transfer ATP-binding protein TraC